MATLVERKPNVTPYSGTKIRIMGAQCLWNAWWYCGLTISRYITPTNASTVKRSLLPSILPLCWHPQQDKTVSSSREHPILLNFNTLTLIKNSVNFAYFQ